MESSNGTIRFVVYINGTFRFVNVHDRSILTSARSGTARRPAACKRSWASPGPARLWRDLWEGTIAKARRSIGAQRNPESQKAILDAARALIAEQGLSGFSIEAVARRAHAGKPTIYRWWPSRALLLLDVYAELKEDLPPIDTGTLDGDVAAFLVGILHLWRHSVGGELFRSVLAEGQSDPQAMAAVAAFHDARKAGTSALFARLRENETPLGPDQARRLADATVSYACMKLLMGRLDTPEAELRAVAKMLTAGARAAVS